MTDKERLKKYWDEENQEACFLGINVQSLYRKNPDAPVSELKMDKRSIYVRMLDLFLQKALKRGWHSGTGK